MKENKLDFWDFCIPLTPLFVVAISIIITVLISIYTGRLK